MHQRSGRGRKRLYASNEKHPISNWSTGLSVCYTVHVPWLTLHAIHTNPKLCQPQNSITFVVHSLRLLATLQPVLPAGNFALAWSCVIFHIWTWKKSAKRILASDYSLKYAKTYNYGMTRGGCSKSWLTSISHGSSHSSRPTWMHQYIESGHRRWSWNPQNQSKKIACSDIDIFRMFLFSLHSAVLSTPISSPLNIWLFCFYRFRPSLWRPGLILKVKEMMALCRQKGKICKE